MLKFTLFASIALLALNVGCQSGQTSEVFFEDSTGHLIVTVEINGKQLRMAWDTGASRTAINNNEVANKIGVTLSTDSVTVRIFSTDTTGLSMSKGEPTKLFRNKHDTTIHTISNNIDLKIGHKKFNIPVFIGSRTDDNFDGVIGGDVINSCHWKLNFANKTILLSDDKINVDTSRVAKSAHLRFTTKVQNVPMCEVTLNDSLVCTMLWDTGMPGVDEFVFKEQSVKFHYDFVMLTSNVSDSHLVVLRSLWDNGSPYTSFSNGIKSQFVLYDKLNVNNTPMNLLFLYTSSDVEYHQGYITQAFARQFDEVVYNPQEGLISMYLYQGEQKEALNKVLKTLLKQ